MLRRGYSSSYNLLPDVNFLFSEVLGHNHLVKEKGYTKAVDMWSLGCVVITLLTGAPPFPKSQGSSIRLCAEESVFNTPAEYRLDRLDSVTEWGTISRRAKSFVMALLLLDERKRMTAAEALKHEWFTNRHHRASFDAVYARAICRWTSNRSRSDKTLVGRSNSPLGPYRHAIDTQDTERHHGISENISSSRNGNVANTCFTPVNRRNPVKLGDFEDEWKISPLSIDGLETCQSARNSPFSSRRVELVQCSTAFPFHRAEFRDGTTIPDSQPIDVNDEEEINTRNGKRRRNSIYEKDFTALYPRR